MALLNLVYLYSYLLIYSLKLTTMKTQKSGNGVKVANINEVTRRLLGSYWDEYFVKSLKASEIMPIWNYKVEGLNLEKAKNKIIQAIKERESIHSQRDKQKWVGQYCANKYSKLLKQKQRSIEYFLTKCKQLQPVQEYSNYKYGNYKYKRRTFILEGIKHNGYPVTALITWDEDHNWDYYSKSYGRPKSSYYNRCVIFKSIEKLGREKTLYTHNLINFSGDFMKTAIIAFFNPVKVKVSKELKSVQLADYFNLNELHKINGYRLFERKIDNMVWDYAIFDTKTKVTYHSFNKNYLISGLKNKSQAKINNEFEEITKETGFKLGFCESGMKQFSEDNKLDYEGVYTRKDLRNIVIQNRNLNYAKYKAELKQIGITLNCK